MVVLKIRPNYLDCSQNSCSRMKAVAHPHEVIYWELKLGVNSRGIDPRHLLVNLVNCGFTVKNSDH